MEAPVLMSTGAFLFGRQRAHGAAEQGAGAYGYLSQRLRQMMLQFAASFGRLVPSHAMPRASRRCFISIAVSFLSLAVSGAFSTIATVGERV